MANKYQQVPRCGICKKLYSQKNDDGSGLCLKCRPMNTVPVLDIKPEPDIAPKGIGDQDFDLSQKQMINEGDAHMENVELTNDLPATIEVLATTHEIKIEDIIEEGKRGVTNFQMIPAMKKAITEESVEKLSLLRTHYLYVFDHSIRYLKKGERHFIAENFKKEGDI